MEHLPERIGSKFRFILLAATRAEQLMRGAAPRVETATQKPASIAIQELLEGKVEWDYGPDPMELSPEDDEDREDEDAAAEDS